MSKKKIKKCKICNAINNRGEEAILLDRYNMKIKLEKINNSYYIVSIGSPEYQGEQDYGRTIITHCPRCGSLLKNIKMKME